MTKIRKVRKAVLPVAGLGTRFLPATKAVPKEMLTVVDKPVVQYVVEEAMAAGIEHFVFVTGRNKAVIEDHFDIQVELDDTLRERGKSAELKALEDMLPKAGATSFTRQQAPLGLGHAVWCARDIIGDEPFALLLPDMVMRDKVGCLTGMVELYNKVGGNIVAVAECDPDEAHKYGIVGKGEELDGGFRITQMVEKPAQGTAPSNYFINGLDTLWRPARSPPCRRRYGVLERHRHLLRDRLRRAAGSRRQHGSARGRGSHRINRFPVGLEPGRPGLRRKSCAPERPGGNR